MHALKLYLAIAVVLIAIALYTFLSPGEELVVGGQFKSASAFEARASEAGYVVLGRFNLSWPAVVYSMEEANNEISLTIPGYGNHIYPGYTGYRLMGVVLKRSDDQYSGFVLRSKSKAQD